MNRGYTKEHYRELVKKLRVAVPDVIIGTDIIVGFPGETEADFQETVDFAREMDWRLGFVAQYSPRPGTASWKLFEDTIPQKEKKRRWEILDQIINKDNLKRRPTVV
jgi:tRNA-2-methylthio-N6-dimethylallyladenosine synthase